MPHQKKSNPHYIGFNDEIIGSIPNSIVRYGNGIFLIIFLLILSFSSIVTFPNTITAEAEVVISPSPKRIISQNEGRLHLLVQEGQNVSKNDVIGHFGSKDNYQNLLKINSELFKIDYSDILLSDLKELKLDRYLIDKDLQEYYIGISEALKRIIASHTYSDSHPIDIYEFNNSVMLFESNYLTWKQENVLQADMEGHIHLFENALTGLVSNGEIIGVVVPNEINAVNAIINVSSNEIHKINRDNRIRIDLSRYPSSEFGYLEGRVTEVNTGPFRNTILSTIADGNIITTDTNYEIVVEASLKGQVQIQLEDKSVLFRVFDPIIELFRKQKI
jgi:hypothetical protein